jgi:predicted RND superfamily exporter protein
VHILAIFYQALADHPSKEDAIAFSLSHSGLAVVMTSLTTAGGLVSFATADLEPIQQLGIITPIGILAALLLTLVLLPALMSIIPMSGRRGVEHREESPVRRALIACGDYATRRARLVVAVFSAVLLWSLAGALQLQLSHDPISWFPEDDPFRIGLERLNEQLRGMMYIETVIQTGRESAMKDPEVLDRLTRIADAALNNGDKDVPITKVISLVDVVKETHRALNENDMAYYVVPQDPQLVAQELLLFESSGPEEIAKLTDTQFSEARMTFKVPMVDAVHYDDTLDEIEAQARAILGDVGTLTFTGETRMMTRVLGLITGNLIRTYIIAFAIIAPLMILLLGSLRMGLVSMIPNLAPILMTLGIMGWFGLPLELFTLLIGGIALGLAVDDTVHFMHNFRRYYEHGADVPEAVRQTLSTTGQALLFTSVVLASGFFIYMLSTMSNLLNFGLLTATTIILAFVADLMFAPALMALLADRLTRR